MRNTYSKGFDFSVSYFGRNVRLRNHSFFCKGLNILRRILLSNAIFSISISSSNKNSFAVNKLKRVSFSWAVDKMVRSPAVFKMYVFPLNAAIVPLNLRFLKSNQWKKGTNYHSQFSYKYYVYTVYVCVCVRINKVLVGNIVTDNKKDISL